VDQGRGDAPPDIEVAKPAPSRPPRRRRPTWHRHWRWLRWVALVLAILLVVASGVVGYYYVRLARLVDDRLQGGLERSSPRVFARAMEIRRGQQVTPDELVDRLNDIGYRQRPRVEAAGEFAADRDVIALVPRGGGQAGRTVRVTFSPGPEAAGSAKAPAPPRAASPPRPRRVLGIDVAGAGAVEAVSLEPPLLSALVSSGREKRRRVALADIPPQVRDAVLAIEDRRFYEHPGVDVIRTAGAIVTNVRGDKPYLVGGSTLTQQLVKNQMLTREKTIRRKLLEQLMAVILERRLTKDQILELYLNEVYLGQRGSFAIHGVAEAARVFFGKDVSNIGLAEAATIAGVIQSPPAYSPFRSPQRSRERRNVVLRAMAEGGYISQEAAERAENEPLVPVTGGVDSEAPYFVDLVSQTFVEQYPKLASSGRGVDIFTTLDPHLQRLAQDAIRTGLVTVNEQLAKKKRRTGAQGALLAVDPRTGDVLALVGGRSYGQSQFNRVTAARRQPGSVFKPFVYLAAFEYAAAEGLTDLTPATIVVDEPTSFYFGSEEWTPGNYNDEYDGPITLRRALAMSRNVATAKVAEFVGFGRIAALWRQVGTSTPPRAYPSIALGVFEATPWEIAQAFTVFPNAGELRPLRTISRITLDGSEVAAPSTLAPKRIARGDTTYLVNDMLRSVVAEGTGSGVRAAGFALDAAGKTGTTNDLRDAWFVGFTPELLTVVWVGFDDNQAIGLSGAQAAVPIWGAFMARALAGHPNLSFGPPPPGVTTVEIDRDTGMLAGAGCPRKRVELFLAGTEPTLVCDQHPF
jgi:penicillin-binding protein 1B